MIVENITGYLAAGVEVEAKAFGFDRHFLDELLDDFCFEGVVALFKPGGADGFEVALIIAEAWRQVSVAGVDFRCR